MDIMSVKERSHRMSLIKNKWTRPEKLIHNFLKGNKTRHRMHPRIVGSPDIILKDKKIAIFIHGCFWHRCNKCYRKPMSNRKFWKEKIENNIKRDKKNARLLRKNGWKVKIIWECKIPINNPKNEIRKIASKFR